MNQSAFSRQPGLPDDESALAVSSLPRREVRPLGTLSDFVVHRLPAYLFTYEKGVERLEDVVVKLITSEETSSALQKLPRCEECVQRTALLDLAMLESALRTRGVKPPPQLLTALDTLGAALETLPGMSYELIIRSNPLEDLRTFTGSSAERFFYSHHELIERELMLALEEMEGGPLSETSLLSSLFHLRAVTRLMTLFGANVPPEDFSRFRPYVDGSRDGMKGPSGLRSSNLFAVAFRILGEELTPRRLKIEKEGEYYPTIDRRELTAAIDCMDEKGDLFSQCRRRRFPEPLAALTEAIAREYLAFLTVHLEVVRGLLPPRTQGTGGTEGMPFLERGIERVESALSRFMTERKADATTREGTP